jgi:hypothetical protein
MAIYAVALAGIVGFPLLWPTSHNSISSLASPPLWSARPAASRPPGTTSFEQGEK